MKKPMKAKIPLDLQMFAEDNQRQQNQSQDPTQNNQNQSNTQSNQSQNNGNFDYEKIASLIAGKQSVAEDTVLKNYFKNQGLSQEEAQTAIADFKKQKASNTPNVDELQSQLAMQTKLAQDYQLQQAATMEALSLGLDQKSIPYVIKLADLSGAMIDGKVNTEQINKALAKVLEDVPQLKPDSQLQQKGGFQIGSNQNTGGQQEKEQDTLAKIFGNK